MSRPETFARPAFLALAWAWFMVSAGAAEPAPSAAKAPFFEKTLRPFLDAHCLSCHDAGSKRGGLDLDHLSPDFADPKAFAVWVKVHDRVRSGEMPPKKKPRPDPSAVNAALVGLDAELVAADRKRTETGRSVFRRLNRTEYENTVRDLLDAPWLNLKDLLPEDGKANGFDKSGTALDISHVQVAKYMEAADTALLEATAATLAAPEAKPMRMYPTDQYDYMILLTNSDCVFLKDGKYDPRIPLIRDKWAHFETLIKEGVYKTPGTVGVFRHLDDAFGGRFGFVCAWPGKYKLRLSVWGYHWDKGVVKPSDRTEAAALIVGGRVVGHFAAPSLKPTVHEVEVWMNPDDTVAVNASSLWPIRVSERGGRVAEFVGPGVAIDWVEVEGPIHPRWPPAGHRRMFGDLPLTRLDQIPPGIPKPARELPKRPQHGHNGRNGHGPFTFAAVVPADPAAQAEKLLKDFLPRAFRRPVADWEAYRYVTLATSRLAAKTSFEDAMRTAYKAALCAPDFLYLKETPGRLDDFALACRLSYFLWGSMPDQELFAAAAKNQLHDPAVLRAQTERMLKDSRAERFVRDFLDQWLNLQDIDSTTPDRQLYPEFSGYLRDSMVGETAAFFRELVAKDLGVINVVDSDFAMLNQKLGELYGIPGVDGPEIRPVKLPPGCHRGGFLTQAAVLKVTANGTTTSPVKRGAWVQRKITGRPPEPPPPDVPAVEPDVRGATTIREQLAKHRNNPGCAGCHAGIDPPGFALESFDVIGRFRDRYRSLEKGDPVDRATTTIPTYGHIGFKNGLPVDPAGEIAPGRPFKNIEEFRALLRGEPRELARNLTSQLLAYSTGSPVGYADRADVESILNKTRDRYGVRSLVHEVVQSRLFQTK